MYGFGNVVRKMYIEFNDFRIRDEIYWQNVENFFLKIKYTIIAKNN